MRSARALLLALVAAVLALAAPAAPSAAQAAAQQPICFPNVPGIADCVGPALAPYWSASGGVAIFGYPISPVEPATPAGAAGPARAQWFERGRLELHPENRAPYTLLLGRVGAERLAQLGRDPRAGGEEAGPQPGCLWFEETRHNVCDESPGLGFRSYWERNGLRIRGLSPYQQSLALFGLPLTTANPEPGPDGELVITQWFERARMEWHPENPENPENPEGPRVLLGLLGREVRESVAPHATAGQASAAARSAAPR